MATRRAFHRLSTGFATKALVLDVMDQFGRLPVGEAAEVFGLAGRRIGCARGSAAGGSGRQKHTLDSRVHARVLRA
jgi:hypothetical protein